MLLLGFGSDSDRLACAMGSRAAFAACSVSRQARTPGPGDRRPGRQQGLCGSAASKRCPVRGCGQWPRTSCWSRWRRCCRTRRSASSSCAMLREHPSGRHHRDHTAAQQDRRTAAEPLGPVAGVAATAATPATDPAWIAGHCQSQADSRSSATLPAAALTPLTTVPQAMSMSAIPTGQAFRVARLVRS